MNGRGFNIVTTILFVVAAISHTFILHDEISSTSNSGLCLPSCNMWFDNRWWSAILNIACIVAIGYMLKHLNSLHGFIRANAAIALSSFMLLEIANPCISSYFFEGTAMLVVTTVSAYIIFSTYHRHTSQRSIFLAFALLSFYTMFQFSAIYLMAVFFLSFIQMRVMHLRGFIAMLMGIITPYWIVLGLGLVTFDSFAIHEMHNAWQTIVTQHPFVIIITCSATALAALVLMMQNMMRIISYNAKRRACNGLFSTLAITTIIMMCVDYTNVITYLPTLNLCLAIQVGHAFTTSNNDRRYIPILALCAICIGMHIYNSL